MHDGCKVSYYSKSDQRRWLMKICHLFGKQEAELHRITLTKGCLHRHSLRLLRVLTQSYSICSFHTEDILLSSLQTMNNKPGLKQTASHISVYSTGIILCCDRKLLYQLKSSTSWVLHKEKYFQDGNCNTMAWCSTI